MKFAHYVMLEVFLRDEKPTCLDTLAPLTMEEVLAGEAKQQENKLVYSPPKTGINVELSDVEGDAGRIIIVRYFFRRASHTNAFFKLLKQELSQAELARLRAECERRLDEHGDFFFRLDKNALKQGRLVLVDRGDCVQVKVSPAAYPKNRRTARDVLLRILDD
ncbi:hypothetical protein D6789_01005 [Candidatus Woesearchaeota archaeon]|nr:MAG: hypothetical protein D6789_01005 [Candidatus Woesearchaeota archaeon]